MNMLTLKKMIATFICVSIACCAHSLRAAEPTTVDILVMYDGAMRNSLLFDHEPETLIINRINQFNAIFKDSQVDIELRLVGAILNKDFDDNEMFRDIEGVLANISSADGHVAALRDQLNADIVVQLLVAPSGINTGGIAAAGNGDAELAYSVVNSSSVPLVMLHEIGHNMGLAHSSQRGGGDSLYSYGKGYEVEGLFSEIMAGPSRGPGETWVARFSNPNLQCAGVPCGIPVGQPGEANAALALQNARERIANFRPIVNYPLITWEGCGRVGRKVGLPAGRYTTSQLAMLAIKNDDISSFLVQPGYTATFYKDDNFTGDSMIRTAGEVNCLPASNPEFYPAISSIIVEAIDGTSSSSSSATSFSSSSFKSSSSSSLKSSNSSVLKSSSSNSKSLSSSIRSSSSSSITTVPRQCNWWGQIVPLCTITTSGWGYENNASCVSVATCATQPESYGVIDGTSSTSSQSSMASTIIAQVEAENYEVMSGVQTQGTTDAGGGLNVGWLDAGDWIAYGGAKSINIPVSGTYTVEFRVASLNGGGSFTFEKNGGNPIYATLNVPNTGDWQNWTTITTTVNLTAGVQGFGIGVKSGGFNINWYRIKR